MESPAEGDWDEVASSVFGQQSIVEEGPDEGSSEWNMEYLLNLFIIDCTTEVQLAETQGDSGGQTESPCTWVKWVLGVSGI